MTLDDLVSDRSLGHRLGTYSNDTRADSMFAGACLHRLARRAAALTGRSSDIAKELTIRMQTVFRDDFRSANWFLACLNYRENPDAIDDLAEGRTWGYIRASAIRFGTCLGAGLLSEYEAIQSFRSRRLLLSDPEREAIFTGAVINEKSIITDFLRDIIFSDRSRWRPLMPDWRTSDAVAIARSMYESRDFAAMPILADALQDAGCELADILDHCRGNSPHVRGCWVVDLVLGKA